MHIPSHYVFVFVALLLGESAVLFVYTVIGLIKSNPLPYVLPPMMAPQQQLPVCAYYGPPAVAQIITETNVITTTVYETVVSPATERVIIQTEIPGSSESTSIKSVVTSTIELESMIATTTTSSSNPMSTSTSEPAQTFTSVVLMTTIIPATASSQAPRSTVFITTKVPAKK